MREDSGGGSGHTLGGARLHLLLDREQPGESAGRRSRAGGSRRLRGGETGATCVVRARPAY